MSDLTPKEIVKELDKHIIGQKDAKKSVALALRNRWRRRNVESSLREEIVPKNILMVGPTGVGKTEVARRLAKLANAPFIKVEATKYTEVGYVGRDVEQIIRDLTETSLGMVKENHRKDVILKAAKNSEKRIIKVLEKHEIISKYQDEEGTINTKKIKKDLCDGVLDDLVIEIQLSDTSSSILNSVEVPGMPGAQVGMLNLNDILGKAFQKTKIRKMPLNEAYKRIQDEEAEKLLDREKIIEEAIKEVEQGGIVFIDEIDKICVKDSESGGSRGQVSREGVQRDLLPLIEGTTVSTKYGPVKTDHILFITSGAFQLARPSDLLPELQGRLPIRVELSDLNQDDLLKILTEPQNSLVKQYVALMKTENVHLDFTSDGLDEIAHCAFTINQQVENIGARRLHTILEKVLEEISFESTDNEGKTITIDKNFVKNAFKDISVDRDLSRFIL